MAGSGTSGGERSAERIYEDLRRRILSGQVAAGEALEGERVLAPSLDTNRNTLREAIRMLEQDRLVAVRHGKAVQVADFRKTARTELIGAFIEQGADVDERVHALEDILRLRIHIIDAVVELAAERAEPVDIERLTRICEAQILTFEAKDPVAFAKGDAQWLEALVDTARSLPLRWMANGLLEVFAHLAARLPTMWLAESSYPKFLRTLVEAIAARDGERARATARTYFEKNDAKIKPLLPAAVKMLGAPKAERGRR